MFLLMGDGSVGRKLATKVEFSAKEPLILKEGGASYTLVAVANHIGDSIA